MKKSTLLLIIGILLIAAIFVVDAFLSNSIDFADASQFGATQYAIIAVEAAALIVAIALIVASRKVARKEKQPQ
ncbi:MAG: hypothetical protein E7437_07345 [Ruminococcaceae bacterium]|nr:hypothetical protein [Oscillospiraceae bacterium]